MPSTARLLSSAFVMEPANVSTPRSTSQSGIDVAMTRTSFAPSSISWRTRCEPRKPVPPVMSVTARWRFSMAARRFVPVVTGVMRAVRLPGFLVGIALLTTGDTDQNPRIKSGLIRGLDPCHLWFQFLLAFAPPQLPQLLRVEYVASAVAQVFNLMPDTRSDQPVRLGSRQPLGHLLEFLDGQEAPDASSDISAFDNCRPFRHRFIRAKQMHGQDAHASVQRQIS